MAAWFGWRIFAPRADAVKDETHISAAVLDVQSGKNDLVAPTVTAQPIASAEVLDRRKSINSILKLMFEQSGKASPEDLLTQLRLLNLAPLSSSDSHSVLGRMLTIRTANALPGTRYLHAQFQDDENGQLNLQHMSFEIAAGENSLQEAVQLAQLGFKNLGQPIVNDTNLIMWDLADGMTFWVQKMSREDLEDDVINPHTIEDVGTVRIVVEQNPEAHVDPDRPDD